MANETQSVSRSAGVPVNTPPSVSSGATSKLQSAAELGAAARSGGAALVQRAADLVDSVVTATDFGSTAAEGSARLLETERLARLSRANVARAITVVGAQAERLGVVFAGLAAGLKSEATSTAGKIIEGAAVSAGTKAVLNAAGRLGYGNVVLLVDMALNYAGDTVFGEENNRKAGGYLMGHAVSTPAKIVVAYGEAIFAGDATALNTFAKEGRAGAYGSLYQGALALGDSMSGSIVDGVEAVVAGKQAVSSSVSRFCGSVTKFLNGR